MLKTLSDVTKNVDRLEEIEKLIKQENKNAIDLIEEQAELINRMINND
jgi:hypothetical protein